MNKKHFTLFFLIGALIFLSISVYENFYFTKEKLKKETYTYLINQVNNFAKNIERYNNLKYGCLFEKIFKSKTIQEEENLYLSSFVTTNFKNIFLLYQDKRGFFRVLADGSLKKEDRFLFNERFDPLKKEKYLQAIKTKKPVYFKQSIEGIWSTYIYPVIHHNKVEYLITIDFSHQAIKTLETNLNYLKKSLIIFSIITIIIIAILISFIIYDLRREIYLQNVNKELEIKVQEAVKEIKKKDEQLILQSRLALMGEILSMIAHQWRQPLNVISTLITDMEVDMMLNEYDKERSKKRINTMKEMIKHLSSTIDDFRAFYRKDNQKELTNINELIQKTLKIASASLNKRDIKIITNLNCNKSIKIYQNELKQIILNLIKNAQDILEEKEIKDPKIEIRAFIEDNKCVIEVKDNGGGVPPEIKDKIFEAYFTTKDEKNGTGLGLYMSQLLVKRMNGKLIEYNDDEGAVFRIELPIE